MAGDTGAGGPVCDVVRRTVRMRKKSLWLFFVRREGGGARVGEGGLAEVAFLVKFWREDGVEKVVDGVGISHQIIRYRDWL